ncbi:PilC/PilY family type IV pilus protein [Thalassotalea ponticola]|uniref:pilus assembly protein n=1 Tax=Thalassotalea ponticola TaxID=1523392 RepID=UPI0025B553D1|nr:PilC/PilY family type IV pilus protein [Thalassotalea ponticola]MDN3653968.1 PilC/PilY family type IV pilus protein [Thalassotalea ponticola]
MKRMISFISMVFLLPISAIQAEDIELYVGDNTHRQAQKPQVLLIFDTSGSMQTEELVAKPPYDPNVVYPPLANEPAEEHIYFSRQGGADPSINDTRKFLKNNNSCAHGQTILDSQGIYLGSVSYYRPPGTEDTFSRNGIWLGIKNNVDLNSAIIDCQDDLIYSNPNNAPAVGVQGYPSASPALLEDQSAPVPYTSEKDVENPVRFTNSVTLYSRNYVRWLALGETVPKSRLEIAKEVSTKLISSAPSVDFGLMTFNKNDTNGISDGGRVVFGIDDMTNANRDSLISMINNEIVADGWTPLCETLYEAAMYLGGKPVTFGMLEPERSPKLDSTVVDNSKYNPPYRDCANEVFVILVTDGAPTRDKDADNLVKVLDGYKYINDGGTNNMMPSLAYWMRNNDINATLPGKQIATTYTVGYGQDAVDKAGKLLTLTAEAGGGKYFAAESADKLLASLQSALLDILQMNTSFTSPSISSNNFDRTETLDSVYYAMFLPERGARWSGNIKKLKIVDDRQVDRDGANAIDTSGNIRPMAKTYWSTSTEPDGPNVNQGGVADMMRSKTSRKVLSNVGPADSLVELTLGTATSSFGDQATLASFMNIDPASLQGTLDWHKGLDVLDEDDDDITSEYRDSVMGDPLHSKPLVINYGGSATNQDIRIIVGTNSGAIHMFQDSGLTVDETWAILPKEYFGNVSRLMTNSSLDDKVYGIDGSATSYIYDKNGDGTITASDGDKVWVFIGSRRGGSDYYALDVSDPDMPKLMWHINNQTSGFNELAQSWSQPRTGYSRINLAADGTRKPVLFIGGGYDTNKDSEGPGSNDSKGRAIYMLDAESGSLLWSATPNVNSVGQHTTFTGATDSIPASIAIMDSDNDGFIDRLYAADTGANLWRVDMPGDQPNDSETPWTVNKIAALGGDSDSNDRRFFAEPSVARSLLTLTEQTTIDGNTVITRKEKPYDVLLVGSGDRADPVNDDTDNKLFMIKDHNLFTQSMSGVNAPPIVTIDDLYDYSDNPYADTSNLDALDLAVSSKNGWYIDLEESGEKSLSAAIAVSGVAYFNSFVPAEDSSAADGEIMQCQLETGNGYLYAVDLETGETVYNWRQLYVGSSIPDTPTVIIPPVTDTNQTVSKIRFVGVGSGDGEGTITLCNAKNCDQTQGISLKTMRTYLYVGE